MKDLFIDQKQERDRLLNGEYIPRETLKERLKTMDNDLIKVIIGPRRAGKSVFAIQLLSGKNFAYLNFDDERLLSIKDYDMILKGIREVYGETRYILFDEIQNLDRWELFVNRLQRKNYRLILTGSNSRLLSRELSTHLTGRYIEYPVYPFSFREYLMARGFEYKKDSLTKEQQGDILYELNLYINSGGYPEIVVKHLEPRDYLTTLFDSVLFKDVVRRYNVRYPSKLHDLALFLISASANPFTHSKLKNTLGFGSVHTVQEYVEYLKESFVILSVKRFSHKTREILKSPEKVYAYDTGMSIALKPNLTRDYGQLIENVVAVELLRNNRKIYYFRAKNGAEVDFVVRSNEELTELLQVCYDHSTPETERREIRGFKYALQELRHLSSKIGLSIITWDYEEEKTLNNHKMRYIPLWHWLLRIG